MMCIIWIAFVAQFWIVESKVEVIIADAVKYHSAITGKPYVIPCTAPDNSFTLDWLHNDEKIASTDRVQTTANGLLLKDVRKSDTGLYTCRVTDSDVEHVAERRFQLDVLFEPEIINADSEHEATAGQQYEMQCLSIGNPKPDHKWIKEQTDLSLDSRFLIFSDNGTIRMLQVEENDQGVYTCIANNSIGTGKKKFSIKVSVKPYIYEYENVTVLYNNEGILTCKAKGRPAPSITFSRDAWNFDSSNFNIYPKRKKRSRSAHSYRHQNLKSRRVTNSYSRFLNHNIYPDIIANQVINEELGESIATLNISRVSILYEGKYDCLAKNEIDSAIRAAHVIVEHPPSMDSLQEPSVLYTWIGHSVNVTCRARSRPKAKIVWYWNDELNIDNNSIIEKETSFDYSQSTLIVTPLYDRYYGTYKCVAVNKHGQAERTIEIKEARPPEPIQSVRAFMTSATSIGFEIISSFTGTPLKWYKYQFKEESEPDWNNSISMTYIPIPRQSKILHINGLRPKTAYNFRFFAENELGASQYIETTHETICDYSFRRPIILNKYAEDISKEEIPFIESPFSDRIELIWEPSLSDCEEKFHDIQYCLGKPDIYKYLHLVKGTCAKIDGITSNNYVISNLTADSYYSVSLSSRFFSSIVVNIKTERIDGDKRLKIIPTHSLQRAALGKPFNLTCKPKVENRKLLSDLSWRDPMHNPINAKSAQSIIYTEGINDEDLLLIIPSVKRTMKGYYYCTASYNGTEIIETYVKIDTYMSSLDGYKYEIDNAGSDTFIRCSIDVPNIEWLFEDKLIESSDHYEFKTYETNSYSQRGLLITNLSESDEGFYICRNAGNDSFNAEEMKFQLEVQVKPEILTFESHYLATEGEDILVECSAGGNPDPELQWMTQNRTDVSMNDRFLVNGLGQMKVRRIEESDRGSYTCVATNSVGMSEKTMELDVVRMPLQD